MTEVEASLECYLAVLHSSWKRAVFWPWLFDQKENLRGLMKENTIKLTTEIETLQQRLFDFDVGGSYTHCLKFIFNLLLQDDFLYPYYICICRIVMQNHSHSLVACREIVVTL